MKIVFVNRFFYPDHSATSQILTDLSVHLAKLGISTHVITSRQIYDRAAADLSGSDNIHNVNVTRVWTTCFGRHHLLGRTVDYVTFYLSAALNLLLLVKPGDIIVAKTDPPLISVFSAIVSKIRKARLVNWIQDLFPEVASALDVGGAGRIQGILRWVRNWSLRSARTNVAIGDGMAKRIAGEGVNPDIISVIHNWSDGCAIQPIDKEENDLRREWGLKDVFVVGYSGNLGRAHEFETILSTAEALSQVEDIVFLFIGGGARQAWVRREVDTRGLKNVVFRPYQPREQLKFSLGVPDVHLISLHPFLEGLIVPSKFYGVAAAGRPVIFIGDTNGEIPRILEDSESGWTIPVGDVAGLERCIRDLAQGPAKVRQAGLRARQIFDSRYSKVLALAQWEEVLRRAAC